MRDIRPEDSYPLTPMQAGMLFDTLVEVGNGLYVQQLVCTFREILDTDHINAAWADVARRHAVLRTTFAWEDVEEAVQEVWPDPVFLFETRDCSQTPASEQQVVLDHVLAADRQQGFALAIDPPWRVIVLKFSDHDWRMIWSFHHILLDGRAHTLLLQEALATYDSLVQGTVRQASERRPFRDYVDWLATQDAASTRSFWESCLGGYTHAPTFPDEPAMPGTEPEYTGYGHLERPLSAEQTAALRECADRHAITLNTLVQAAWAMVLGRHANTTDVVFGATRACRYWTPDGAKEMLGLFINTLPFRVDVAPDHELGSWLAGIRQLQVDLRPYEHAPLTSIHEWSDVPPAGSLFNTILVFENFLPSKRLQQANGNPGRQFELHERTNYVSLAAYADDQMLLCLEFPRTRHPDRQMTFVLGHVVAVLMSIADAGPDARLSDIDMCAPGEREMQLTDNWRGEKAPFPRGTTFFRIVEAQVERTPDNIAIETDSATLTYRELNALANRLARHLTVLGVDRGESVGVCMDRSLEVVVALLAIWKAGAVYVPLDPEHPKERLSFCIGDSGAVLVLTQSKLFGNLPKCLVPALKIEEELRKLSCYDGGDPDIDVGPRDPSYILYTSGSTGNPKGVLSEHEGLCNLMEQEIGVYGLTSEDRIVFLASPSFDVSLHDVCSALRVGATLVIGEWEQLRAGDSLAQFLRDKRITMAMFTPAFLRTVPKADLPDLRLVGIGGEPCPQELVDEWQPGRRFINNYGPTEVTIQTCCQECFAGQSRTTIGRSYPNVEHYVLDEHLSPVAVGAAGELCIAGVGVARAYLNQPRLTAEHFVKHPFSDQPDMRLYRTGDLARFLSDGRIDYLRRGDNQVKVQGVRVELGEIETMIREHPAVKEAAVLFEDKRLSAYCTASGSQPPVETALRRFLSGKLAHYLIPADLFFLDALPRTVTGKIDRHALSAMEMPSHEATDVSSGHRELTKDERHRVLIEWNRTEMPFPRDRCVHELVHDQAMATPDTPALRFGEDTMSYGTLDAKASELAAQLRQAGIERETPVVVLMDKSFDVVLAFLAVLRAGGSYVPIDPDVPDKRVEYVVTNSGAPVALTQSHLAQRLAELPVHAIAVDTLTLEAPCAMAAADVNTDPTGRAYIIYTSGSTGAPKGVEIEHRSLANLVAFYGGYLRLTSTDHSSMLASIAFDASVADLWPYLAVGACVHIPPPEAKSDPDQLIDWISAEGITIAFVPTALAEVLLVRQWPQGAGLRFLLTGGDTLHARPRSDLPFVTVNTYGPTENTVDSTWGVVEHGTVGRPTIGRPIGNVTCYIVDDLLQPVPIGVPGELLLGGEGIARGYLHRPDLTAERFVTDPFAGHDGARLYRTGDLVRYCPDGEIEFLGRIDDQVQIRGFRVELGEIEEALRSHPAVRDATIRPIGAEAKTEALAAYVVCSPATDAADLRKHIREHLPAYMVPASYVFLDSLPRNVSGKVDRNALPEPDTTPTQELSQDNLPQDDVEATLVEIWHDVLGVVPVGIHDNFFDLGGHSILILRLVARIEERIGCKLAVASLLQAPTVARLAESLRDCGCSPTPQCIIEMQKGEGRRPLFCVAGAGGGAHWFHEMLSLLDPQRPFYVLEFLGLSEETQTDGSVEVMAREFVAAIRDVQPEGPYQIGGFSAGGMVAYEMAQQFIEVGQQVSLLYLVDTYGPGARPSFCQRVCNYVHNFRSLSGPEKCQFFHEKILWLRYLVKLWCGTRDIRKQQKEHWQKMDAQVQATSGYAPKPFPGALDLFRAANPPRTAPRDPEAGWTGIPEQGIRIHVVPGNHFDMFKPPNNKVFIAKLQECMDRAEEAIARETT